MDKQNNPALNDIKTPDFKSITSGTKEITDQLIKVIPEFKKAGISISLIASGVFFAVVIIVLSFFSGKGEGLSTYLGITVGEELLFVILSISFVALGVIHSIKYNSNHRQIIEMRLKLVQAEMQMNHDLNNFIHEETMERISLLKPNATQNIDKNPGVTSETGKDEDGLNT